MKTTSKIAQLTGNASLAAVLALSLLINYSSHAAYAYWGGGPGITATTNWTDAANWTYAAGSWSGSATYFNQVEFAGVGASANNNFAVNNVLDNTTGVAQMPMWELDYVPTNGNYTTLIDPGSYHDSGGGQSRLPDGGRRPVEWKQPRAGQRGGDDHHHWQRRNVEHAGSGANLWVGQGSPTLGDSHNVTLDLSGLDNFQRQRRRGQRQFHPRGLRKPNPKQLSRPTKTARCILPGPT